MSKHIKDEVGNVYGKLTVLSFLHINKRGAAVWNCKCNCGNIFKCEGVNLRNGTKTQCDKCAFAETRAQRVKSEIGNVYGELKILSFSHINSDRRAVWVCQCKCGIIFECTGKALRNGSKTQCDECSAAERGTISSKNLVGKKFGLLTVVSLSKKKHKQKRRYWNCVCNCGNKTVVPGDRLISGHTCSCGCIKSRLEMECKLILSRYKIEFETQKTFKNCVYKHKLRFDIYIPSLNTCIELDGKQHYEVSKFFGGKKAFKERKERDVIKNKYCSNNNIKLLRIPYTQFDNIEQILIDNKIIKNDRRI